MPGLFTKKKVKHVITIPSAFNSYLKQLSRKTDALARQVSPEYKALELLFVDEKESLAQFIHLCFTESPCDLSHLGILLDLITSSEEIRRVTLSSSEWWTGLLDATLLSKTFSKRQAKLRSSVHALVCQALSVWRLNFSSEYPLLQSAISRSETAGFIIADIAKDRAAIQSIESDAFEIEKKLIDLEIATIFPKMKACAERIENALNILFPQTLEEAFAGVALSSSVGSASVADSVCVNLATRETESNSIIFDQLRENFKIFRKLYSAKLVKWSEISLEISSFQKNFSSIEGRVVLLLGTKSNPLPVGIDEEYIDDF